jgi:small conductance mechanosensitive channel
MRDKFSIEDAIAKLWNKLDGWLDALILKLPNIIMAFLVMVLFYFLAKGVVKLLRRTLLPKIVQVSIRDIIAKVTSLAIILVGFFIALGVLELDKILTSILAGAGVVGLAVGLALQGTLSNTFGGLVLSFLPRLRINDYIETSEGSGFVDEISLRNIVIRRPDNNYVVVPNSKFIDGAFTNYSLTDRSRISLSCGVGYESDLQKVEDLTIKVIKEAFPQKNNEDVEFIYTEFGDSSINFKVLFWIDMVKVLEEHAAKHEAIKLIKTRFDENDINIPFPIRTMDFGKNNLQMTVMSKDD